jgi:hypothetical protein
VNISYTQTIKLNEAELKELLKDYVSEKLKLNRENVKSIKFKYGNRSSGYGPMEHVEIEYKS